MLTFIRRHQWLALFVIIGEIRHITSTADAGTARVTLDYGSHDGFSAACRTLNGR